MELSEALAAALIALGGAGVAIASAKETAGSVTVFSVRSKKAGRRPIAAHE